MCILFIFYKHRALLKVVGYYDLSCMSKSVMDFNKSSIQLNFGFLEL